MSDSLQRYFGRSSSHSISSVNYLPFEDLPIEVIRHIFSISEFGNNLPLTNKYLNRILKFNPNASTKTDQEWDNLPLALAVAKFHFCCKICDSTKRGDLDFYISKKSNQIRNQWEYYNDMYPDSYGCSLLSQCYSDIQIMRQRFLRVERIVSGDILKYRFCSGELLKRIFTDLLAEMLFSFTRGPEMSRRGSNSFSHSFELADECIKYLSAGQIHIDQIQPESLFYYNSSPNLSVESLDRCDKSNDIVFNELDKQRKVPAFPVNSNRKLDIWLTLCENGWLPDNCANLLIDTLSCFSPEALPKSNYNTVTLIEITEKFLNLSVNLEGIVINYLNLFDIYSNIDISHFPLNSERKTIRQDLHHCINYIFLVLETSGISNFAHNPITEYIKQSRNENLIAVYLKYFQSEVDDEYLLQMENMR